MNYSPTQYYETLIGLVNSLDTTLFSKYKQLRDLLERICKDEMNKIDLQATDLSARISFVSDKYDLTYIEQQRLHSFRITSNNILNAEAEAETDLFLRDVKTITFFIKKISGEGIPDELYRILPVHDSTYHVAPLGKQQIKRMRVCFQKEDKEYLYVLPTDCLVPELLKVRYNIDEYNSEFKDIRKQLWTHAQLNLLDIRIDDEGVLSPRIIVIEPDYLIDISALAECYRPYGAHPYNYILSRLQPIDNPRPLLLGSIANHFLDEWIYADDEVDYKESMKKVFKKYAIELASCPDLNISKTEKEFFISCKEHFDHINQTVNETFNEEGYKLDKSQAVLEPSYICEALGVQGRLDYMQSDMSSFIEMKSGKADEYFIRGKIVPHTNHRVQMLLYQAMLEYNMGQDHKEVRPYLFYTRYPLLYPARTSWRMIQEAINLRNSIVSTEFNIQSENSIDYTASILQQITPENVNIKSLDGTLWKKFLSPQIALLSQLISQLSIEERAYFFATYNFITKELYTSKSGDISYESKRGASALWNASLADKCENGAIILDLTIAQNRAADIHKPFIVLNRNLAFEKQYNMALPNFRDGDAVVLYERTEQADNVTNKLVFKGNIESIREDQITIRLRAAQRNQDIIHEDSLFAIEPDSMDTTFRNMYLSLDAFLKATQERKDLLLGKREPQFNQELYIEAQAKKDDLDRIVGKAIAAKDYLLLVGPPGTGKTSFALRRMVEEFNKRQQNILLLAYTNQAVDEICKSVLKIDPKVHFIRLGSELSCHPNYRKYLLEEELANCGNRQSVRNVIQQCNIYVSTVASLSGKLDLFILKHFDVAIIDEASQILEPQLIGLLTAKHNNQRNAIDKFILIGDHKQLPAVVQQKEETSQINCEELEELHITNMRDALFERLYRLDYPKAKEILLKQGRMHPEISEFVNDYFYNSRLSSLNLAHQCDQEIPISKLKPRPYDTHLKNISSRITFIGSNIDVLGESVKTNNDEAEICAHIAHQIVEACGDNFDPNATIGIITPYRSQIALIKNKIASYQDERLESILIDTVERFQGSERDFIIYSFCVNTPYQLDFLSNVIIENGKEIDRKLNVALTRARKQLFITGVPEILRLNTVYRALLDYIKTKEG